MTAVTALIAAKPAKRARGTAPATQKIIDLKFYSNEGMVGPQDTYNACPNVKEVVGPNSGSNILTIFIYICSLLRDTL